MKWFSESELDREHRLKKYHRYFAWFPVYCYETKQIVWLEFVLRKAHFAYTSMDGSYIDYWSYKVYE